MGAFLNVHEGPQSISQRADRGKFPLEPGMLLSNGVYVCVKLGVLCVCVVGVLCLCVRVRVRKGGEGGGGHGVGAFLCVHENPQSISQRADRKVPTVCVCVCV